MFDVIDPSEIVAESTEEMSEAESENSSDSDSNSESDDDNGKKIEKILAHRIENKGDKAEELLLIKWEGLSYRKTTWERKKDLMRNPETSARVSRFLKTKAVEETQGADDSDTFFDPSYTEIEKIVRMKNEGGTVQFLVRWRGLDASEMTWEPLAEVQDDAKIGQYYRVLMEQSSCPRGDFPRKKKEPSMQDFVFKIGLKLRNYQEVGVNWLLTNWYNGQGSILGDEVGFLLPILRYRWGWGRPFSR